MMNQMPYQQPQMWPINPNQGGMQGGSQGGFSHSDNPISERLNNLENQVNRIERQLRRIENRLNRIENSMIMPLSSQQDTGYGSNSSKYMM